MLYPPMVSTRSGKKCRLLSRRDIHRDNYSPTMKSKPLSTPAKSPSRSRAKFIGVPSLGRGRIIKRLFPSHAGGETVAGWRIRISETSHEAASAGLSAAIVFATPEKGFEG